MYDNWVANGWLRGKSPIKDWKASFRTWQSGGYLPSQGRNGKSRNGHESHRSKVELVAPENELTLEAWNAAR
jgi:hypothetical protein